MATATAVPAIETLAHEVAAFQNEIARLQEKVDAGQTALGVLLEERGALSEKIAMGKAKPEAAPTIAAQISGAQAAVTGFRQIIERKQRLLDERATLLRRMREDAARQKELDEVAHIEADGMAALSRISDALQKALSTELVNLEESRSKLRQILGRGFLQFPAPPASVAANNAHNKLGAALVEELDPILKLIGR
jgi:chromosome segregation ATPase